MKNVFIISDYSDEIEKLRKEIGISDENTIEYESNTKDEDIHNWTKMFLSKNNIEKLVIPISLNEDETFANTLGLEIAMHIRLNYELDKSKRLISIIFISDFPFKNIIKQANLDIENNTGNILFTEGAFLSTFDIEEIKECIKNSKSCKEENYSNGILNKLNVIQKMDTGKHSLANAWGCYKLAQLTGNRDEIINHKSISEKLKTLYSKYLICKNDIFDNKKFIDLKKIKNLKGKKVLFIDDQADEGWSLLIKNIFNGADITIVDSAKYKNKETTYFTDYNGFIKECERYIGLEWDLILMDLRLNPEEDKIDNEETDPKELSGYKLIDEFLNFNEGYHIILLTASNKIWNINSVLERGATSYYIKESPEFNNTLAVTKKYFENFKSSVEKCFNQGFLFSIYEVIQEIKGLLNNDNDNKLTEFFKKTKINLDVSFELLKKSSNNKTFKNYAYLQLFYIIEDLVKTEHYIDNNEIICNSHKIIFFKENDKNYNKAFKYKKALKYNNNSKIYSIGQVDDSHFPGTYFKVSSLLIFRFGFKNSDKRDWKNLNGLRNDFAHGNEIECKEEDLKKILNFIYFLLDDKNQKDTNIDKGLRDITDEERLKMLQDKLNT